MADMTLEARTDGPGRTVGAMDKRLKTVMYVVWLGAAFALGMNTHPYWALNGGIVLGPAGFNVGVEVKGHPGLFFNAPD